MNKDTPSELRDILISHSKKYPKMRPCDGVKLIFQNEFGGGHLIKDEDACLAYLEREYKSAEQTDTPLTEDIGGGIVRVELSALDANGITPSELCAIFIRSAELISGSLDSFKNKLSLLRELTQKGHFEFTVEDLDIYIEKYAAAGYPAVSHSEDYREAYHPSYRIVLADLLLNFIKEKKKCNR